MRQVRIGAVSGLLVGLALNGALSLPMTTIYQIVEKGAAVSTIAEEMGQGRYRVVMHCPVKYHRVTYHVQAEQAGRAHMALEWVMPACSLSGMAKASAAELGMSWYRGEFFCEGNFYKKTLNIAATNMRQVQDQARALSEGCRIEAIDQTNCAFLSPLCIRESQDFERETALASHRMLR